MRMAKTKPISGKMGKKNSALKHAGKLRRKGMKSGRMSTNLHKPA